ncbi:hypothetical protein EVAR_75401_1 [Eumeta japonica]|uniref:Uncharacterized protein n=1 Tax=Eumeta variegata TaxID=151549 RepID=A0A4C1TJT1_EUMVA|nr:hypothetical protein EVAR_75401_1 [Eumeta japonica]
MHLSSMEGEGVGGASVSRHNGTIKMPTSAPASPVQLQWITIPSSNWEPAAETPAGRRAPRKAIASECLATVNKSVSIVSVDRRRRDSATRTAARAAQRRPCAVNRAQKERGGLRATAMAGPIWQAYRTALTYERLRHGTLSLKGSRGRAPVRFKTATRRLEARRRRWAPPRM